MEWPRGRKEPQKPDKPGKLKTKVRLIQMYLLLLHCHGERPKGAWPSHQIKKRSPRRSAPRDDTLIIAFILVLTPFYK